MQSSSSSSSTMTTTTKGGSPLFEASRRIMSPKVGGRARRLQLREQRKSNNANKENNNDSKIKEGTVEDSRGDVSEGATTLDTSSRTTNGFFGRSETRESDSSATTQRSPPPQSSSSSNPPVVDLSTTTEDAGTLFRGDRRQHKIVYNDYSDKPLEVLHLEISDIPEPSDENHVVVKITASTVSLQDCMIRKGVALYNNGTTNVPLTPGMDIVGTIVSCGNNVRSVYVGDRVAALCGVGGNARYISVPESSVVHVPRSLDAAEAVCMVSTYLTAYQAIRKVTKDSFSLEGKRILITGSIEPISQALIQLCLRAGALEIYATAPTIRHRYVKSVLGAHPLPLEPDEWLPLVKDKMDVVFDVACQDGLSSPYSAVRDDDTSTGVLVCLGMTALLGRETPGVFGAPLEAYWARMKGQLLIPNAIVYDVWESFVKDPNSFKLDLEILFHLLKKKFIKPHIAKRIPLSDVAVAHANLEDDVPRGEVVCLPWKRGKAITSNKGKKKQTEKAT